MIIRTLAALTLLLAAPAIAAAQTSKPVRTLPAEEQFADSLLKKLPLRARIAQLFVTFANGEFYAEESEDFQYLKRRVQTDGVGGIIFSTGDIYDQAVLTNRLQKIAPVPLLISQDMEYGAAMRIRGTTRLTPAMGIAATGDPRNAFWAGRITAAEAKAVGVHQVYAPVADVNNNAKNPIINVRSYSEDPRRVAEFASSFMKGVLAEGLIPTAKHFPGHGDTDVDSHVDMPVIRHPWTRLDSVELVPFRRLIAEGIPSVMSAHISFPNMSTNPGTPGTLDRNVLGRLLRDSLKFTGVITTDALTMEAIARQFSPGKTVIMALEAGADVMLMSVDETSALDEIERAVQAGRIPESRIDQSVRKLLIWKYRQGLFKDRFVPIETLKDRIGTARFRAEAQRIARESVTLLRNNGDVLPVSLKKHPKVMVITISDDESGTAGRVLAREVRKYHPEVQSGLFDGRTSAEERDGIIRRAEKSDLLIIASNVFVRMEGKIGFSKEQSEFARRLAALRKPEIAISFGSPYILAEFPEAEVHIAAWSNAAEQVEQTVPALFGASAIGGRLPITIPSLYAAGTGIQVPKLINRVEEPLAGGFNRDRLRAIDRIVEQAIRDSVFPGAQVAVLHKGLLVLHKGYGYHTYEKNTPVKTGDVYDMASLTKVMATTTAVMMLVDEKKLSLTDPVEKFFPEYKAGNKKKVTIRHLLEHTSGLAAFRAYGDSIKTRDALLKAVLNEPLLEKPGAKVVYSDLGFMTLGAIVEKVAGEPLDKFMQTRLYTPAGMNSTGFSPARRGNGWMARLVPTENDTVFRNKLMKGEVHDERAWIMGGVSGHAGLFSNAQDAAAWAALLLNGGSYAGQSFIRPETVAMFTARPAKSATRALGFDLKTDFGSSAGAVLSTFTFGHTGFTGTSVWIDPKRDLAVILLTNRVHPYRRYGAGISKVRAAVADAAASALEPAQ